MSKELVTFLLSLTEEDGIQAIRNAKAEAIHYGCSYKQTPAYKTYRETVDLLTALSEMSSDEVTKTYTSNGKQIPYTQREGGCLTLNHIQFCFVENKMWNTGLM